MKLVHCAIIFAVMLPNARAQQQVESKQPWLTGAQLINQLTLQQQQAHRRQATLNGTTLYITGVYDATVQKDWCYTGKNKPNLTSMKVDLLASLRKMPPEQLQRNAAELIVEAWQMQWPCPPDGCCHD